MKSLLYIVSKQYQYSSQVSRGRTLGTYKRVCCVRLLLELGWGDCDLQGKVHGDVQRGESDGKKGPSPSLGPRAATLAHGMERKKAGIPTAARTMGRDEEALP